MTTQAPDLMYRLNPYSVVLQGEVHLVARGNAQTIAHHLRNDDLSLWPHSRSHTTEYNRVGRISNIPD